MAGVVTTGRHSCAVLGCWPRRYPPFAHAPLALPQPAARSFTPSTAHTAGTVRRRHPGRLALVHGWPVSRSGPGPPSIPRVTCEAGICHAQPPRAASKRQAGVASRLRFARPAAQVPGKSRGCCCHDQHRWAPALLGREASNSGHRLHDPCRNAEE